MSTVYAPERETEEITVVLVVESPAPVKITPGIKYGLGLELGTDKIVAVVEDDETDAITETVPAL